MWATVSSLLWMGSQLDGRKRAKMTLERQSWGRSCGALKTMTLSCGDGGPLLKGFKEGNGSQEWGMDPKIAKLAAEKLCRGLCQ